MSDAVIWSLIRKNNAFLHKRGHTKRAGAVQLSCEPGNVMSVSSFKYSGLANSKTADIGTTIDVSGRTFLDVTSKVVGSSKFPRKAKTSTKLKLLKKAPSVVIDGVCMAETGTNYYRPDLKRALAIKFQKLSKGIRVKQGNAKKGTSGTGRSKK